MKEVTLLHMLRHMNIPRFYGISTEKTKYKTITYLILEKIDGQDLGIIFESYSSNDVSEIIKIKLAADIAYTLAYVHNCHIIHRDLKPSNIMIEKGMTIKLLDFGISKQADKTQLTFNPRIGTFLYFSPEHVAKEADVSNNFEVKLSKKSDVWSLGLIISQLFSWEILE